MKYLILCLCLPLMAMAALPPLTADLQLHRDFDREVFTGTVELFESDSYGSTFYFSDFDFDSAGQTASYFELTRNLPLVRSCAGVVNASLQFNDGVLASDAITGKGIPRTVLGGVMLNEFSCLPFYLELQGLAREEFGAKLGWQFTTVWSYLIPRTPLEFLGYFDWNSNYGTGGPTSFQAEPQLQACYKKLALGTEWEISRNFTGAYTRSEGFSYRKWYVHPTLFLRVDF